MRNLFLSIICILSSSGLWGVCTATKHNADYSPIASGSTATLSTGTGSDGQAHVSAVNAVGDMVLISVWCYQNCTFPSTMTMGSMTATRTATVTPGTTVGIDGLHTGQTAIYYILSAASSGNQALSVTVTNLTGGPQTQLSYIDFGLSAGCTATHHLDSSVGSATGGGTANTPSLSSVTGDVLYGSTVSTQHVNSPVNSPWSCPVYSGSSETQTCNIDVTQNGQAYILSAASGTVSNNWTLINSSTGYEAILSSFTMSGSGAANACPAGVPSGITNCVFVSSAGSDSNSGATEATSWLHAPGMPNCSGNCALWSGSGGKGVILRGGDTWHFGNSGLSPYTGGMWNIGTWAGTNATCVYEGATTGCIYWGVDQAWFSGASWARPIMNGDNPIGNPALNGANPRVSSCTYQVAGGDNIAISAYNAAYIQSFEMRGFCSSRNIGSTGPSQDLWIQYGGDGPLLEDNIYIHGWSASTAAGTSNNVLPCTLIGGSTQGTATQSISNLVIDGSDSPAPTCAWALFPRFTHLKNSIIRYTVQGVGGACHDIHDNIFEYIFNPDVVTHGNILECNDMASGSTPNVWYNNTMRHIEPGFFSSGQVGWWFCPGTVKEFWFNNIAYDLGLGGAANGNFWAVAGTLQYPSCTAAGTQKMFNNTFSGGMQPCFLSGSNNNAGNLLTVVNEHLINSPYDSSSTGHTNPCVGGAGSSSNVSQTWVQSTTQSYTQSSGGVSDATTCSRDGSTPCSPTTGSNSTVNSGLNEQAFCTTLASFSSETAIGTEAANACKLGTTNGCTYNLTTHSMSCPAQTAVSRPLSAAWDSGAYEFSGGSLTQAAQPTCSPATGTANPAPVTLSTTSGGAIMCYNFTGSPATNGVSGCAAGSTLYSGTITIGVNETLSAVAGGTGFSDSSIRSCTYTVTAPGAPTLTLGPVTMNGGVIWH